MTDQPSPDTPDNTEQKTFASAEYAHLFEEQNKLIDCPQEIVFTVLANVLSQNDKGEYIGSKEICKKKYHIPIPEKQDYNIFMQSFFQFLEGCLASSAKHAYSKEEKQSNE